MIYKILAIRDRAADCFGQPIFTTSTGGGIRSFGDAINGQDKTLAAHPEDFDLYLLGIFDDNTGTFTQDGPAKMIAVGKDLVVHKPGDPRQTDAFN